MVSIIITSYNNENTIDRAINSALNQSYQNCEVIVIDDCSNDNSSTIYQEYGNKIRVYRNEKNEGLPYSRQVGIHKSHGRFIAFLDADDYLSPHAIQYCMDNQKTNDADILQMKISRKIGKFGISLPFYSKYDSSKALDACLYDEHLFPIQCWGKLYKADLLKSTNKLEYSGFWGEDRIFNIPVIASKPTIEIVGNAKYNYSWGGTSSSNFDINALQEYKQVYQIKHNWAQINGYEQFIPMMQKELTELLKYHIRHLINSNSLSFNNAIEYLQDELEQPFWASFKLPQARELYSAEKKSLSRVLKKSITNLIKQA